MHMQTGASCGWRGRMTDAERCVRERREINQVRDNNWEWMEVDGQRAADNEATGS